jgi:hypothetical protein
VTKKPLAAQQQGTLLRRKRFGFSAQPTKPLGLWTWKSGKAGKRVIGVPDIRFAGLGNTGNSPSPVIASFLIVRSSP